MTDQFGGVHTSHTGEGTGRDCGSSDAASGVTSPSTSRRTLSGSDITWPGVDRDRAIAAHWHLTRAVQHCGGLRSSTLVPDYQRTGFRIRTGKAAEEHLRIARGYLGAVGFEKQAGR